MKTNIDGWRILLAVSVVLFFGLFSLLGLWRHSGFLTSINDLGVFDQTVWMASMGQGLVNTSNFSMPVNWLGFHFQPILFAFSLLYKITPSVNWLILAQAAALAISAWPVFLLAERVTASRKAAFMWTLAYLCNPFMLNAAAWDFHPISIAVPFLSLGLLAVDRKQSVLLVVVCLILVACKEHMGLMVAGLGLLYGIHNRAWPVGLALFVAGMGAFFLIVAVVMPAWSVTGEHPMFGDGAGQLSRYAWLGGNPEEVLRKIVDEPLYVVRSVVEMGGLEYVFLLLLPFLFLPLAGILWLLPAIADISVNLLSANPMPRSIFSYHSVAVIPIVAVAAIHGSVKLAGSVRSINPLFQAHMALLVSLILGYAYAPLPLPGSENYWKAIQPVATNDPQLSNIREIISNGSVSAQANVAPHFSQRPEIYRFPEKVGTSDYVILRMESPTQRIQPYDKATIATLSHHLVMDPFDYLGAVSNLLRDTHYEILVWQDPWLVLKRGEGSVTSKVPVFDKIERLARKWSDAETK